MSDDLTSRSPLEEQSKGRFGGGTYPVERLITVGTSLTVILPNNPNRTHWIVQNESVNLIRASSDPTITATSGWYLAASGGVISQDYEEDGEGVGYPLYGISSVAGSVVRVREVIRL